MSERVDESDEGKLARQRPVDAAAKSGDLEPMFGSAIERVRVGWDDHIERFLSGGGVAPAGMERWAESYQGTGRGVVEWDALPEPLLGDLGGDVRGVFLALIPGKAALDFQSRYGVFAQEIRELGSYREWARSWAYLREPWTKEVGLNRHHRSRMKFLRRWVGDPRLPHSGMVGFELYPWHSTNVTGKWNRPSTLCASGRGNRSPRSARQCSLFGAPWFDILEHGLGLRVIARLGAGDDDYGSTVESRAVLILRDEQSGVAVAAEKHSGSAGPPNDRDSTAAERRRCAFGRCTELGPASW